MTEKNNSAAGKDMFDNIELFLAKNSRIFLGISLALSAFLCYLLFNGAMSFATDDAEYLKRAYGFVHFGSYPGYQGPLYPLFLSLLFKIFGFNVPVFKMFSGFLLLGQIFFFYKAFKGRIPYLILFMVLIFLSVNSYILYFGSQTFTEAFAMCMESLAFWVFFTHIDLLATKPTLKTSWKSWLLFGLMLFLLSITKNVLLIGTGAAILYFLLYTEWKNAILTVLSFVIIKIPYEIMTRVVFHYQNSAQFEQAMRKDFYDPSKGYEDLGGYFDRFFDNFNSFISVQVFKVLGLRPEYVRVENSLKNPDPSVLLSLLFAVIAVASFVAVWKKNRYAVFSFIYAIGILFATFTILQTIWNDQQRLVIPYLPYLLVPVLLAAWYKAKSARQAFLKPAFVILAVIFIFIQFPLTSKKVSANSRGLKYYLKGDMTYGTPDQFADFIAVCESIPQKVPADSIIATGKPGEAFVYSKFYNFQRLSLTRQDEGADSVLADLRRQRISYLLFDRMNRQVSMAVSAIGKKYPDKLVPILQSGTPEEGVYLLQVKN